METFKFSTDPQLAAKIHDVVGLYLDPPEKAVKVCVACYDRHRSGEFLAFLKQLAKAHPRVRLHVVVDNYATHNLRAWLDRHRRIRMHFTPTGCSWLNRRQVPPG